MLPNEKEGFAAAGAGADDPNPNEKDPVGGADEFGAGAPPKENDGAVSDGFDEAGVGADAPNENLGVSSFDGADVDEPKENLLSLCFADCSFALLLPASEVGVSSESSSSSSSSSSADSIASTLA